MSNEEEIKVLKSQRSNTKGCMTRIKKYIDANKDKIQRHDLECRLGLLEAYFKQAFTVQSAIDKLVDTGDKGDSVQCEIEELYCSTKSIILNLLSEIKQKDNRSDLSFNLSTAVAKSSNLPKLKLPQFSGKYTEYSNFASTFKTLVDLDTDLSPVEKLQHLRNCLSGQAFDVIKNLDITNENYVKAKTLLEDRYNNKCIIFLAHIKEIFNASKVNKASAYSVRSLLDKLNSHLQLLKSLGRDEEILDSMLIYIASEKIDSDSRSKWEDSLDMSELPTWEKYSKFLTTRSQVLENKELNSKPFPGKVQPNIFKPRVNSTALTVTKGQCAYCRQSDHNIFQYKKFTELSVMNRFLEIKKLGLCINCLSKGHSVKKCTSSKCKVCSEPHHSLLHRYNNSVQRFHDNLSLSNAQTSSSSAIMQQSSEQAAASASTSLHSSKSQTIDSFDSQVILATAIVEVRNCDNIFFPARALLDSASQLNFITENLAQTLNLKRSKIEGEIRGIGNISSKVRHSTIIKVRSRFDQSIMEIKAWILPKITAIQPEREVDVNEWDIPSNFSLADPHFNIPSRIDILLGASTFFNLLDQGQIRLGTNLPVLQNTTLGWVIAGNCKTSAKYQQLRCNFATNCESYGNENSLNQALERFWELEEVANPKMHLNSEQLECEQSFVKNVKRQVDGRLIVKLPFNPNSSSLLGNSYTTALKRLLSVERRLGKDPDLKKQYTEFMTEYEDLGHMVLVPQQKISLVKYYMPHQFVLRPDSTSTKLRVIFDASSRTSSNVSLNDTLMVGPTVQNDLFSIILRFRRHRYALTADISKMYRQFLVDESDTYFQGILWRKEPEENLSVYRLKTVTYGTSSAPFIATRCLSYLAEEHSHLRVGSKVIKDDFYMDDLITGGQTKEELNQIQSEVEQILSSGKLVLRKWYSNNPDILQSIPESDRESTLRINDVDVIKTLGIIWEPNQDQFHCVYAPKKIGNNVTKRTVLADLAQLFDPLGIINPVVVTAKVFMQELWLKGLEWDEEITEDLARKWNNFKNQLQDLNKVSIPRFLFSTNHFEAIELHGFADASSRAYGCCIYTRCVDINGDIKVNLLCAKSRVAPVKVVTIPRLELCAAQLLSILVKRIHAVFEENLSHTYLWTDSEIVLNWISHHPTNYQTFVANRVAFIQETTRRFRNSTWAHISTKLNPADIISRGSTVEDLLASNWLTGPNFLQENSESWPHLPINTNLEDTIEQKELKTVLTCTPIRDIVASCKYINNFRTLRRIFAYLMKFVDNVKTHQMLDVPVSPSCTLTKIISPEELERGLNAIIYVVQRVKFDVEIRAIERGQCLPTHSQIKTLNPFIESKDHMPLLRVGGRLQNADLPYEATYPILLPKDHPFTLSYINYLHLKLYHAGAQALVVAVRENLWVVNIRDIARKVLHKCVHCFRYKPKTLQQIMGHLPDHRVRPARPFLHCGVDFCGPVLTSLKIRGRTPYKTYIAVFVCFSTKATHLEVVSDLSADAFIAALKRMVARRGICAHLYCDNATNFVGARNQLAELRKRFWAELTQQSIHQFCADSGITFHHIPPRSPHFGGLWESTVKQAKYHLYRVLGQALLTFEELSTVVMQIEAIINSRPLTPLSSDPSDEECLTPGHFLVGGPLTAIPNPEVSLVKISALNRWQRISALQQHFWKRWSREYISQLQIRYKWKTSSPNVMLGTMVLLAEENLPPQKWVLGRIIEVVVGKDGYVRVVVVKTKNGLFRRAVHKVAPLPLDD